ncbi:MAG: tetratricopeptide repeat protein [Leptospiraceae bacterium]|nr:tetratricopeptide repeat protein [Leptospiraceae bacterium]MDW8307259.1 tetratricopeptide repeat protein [Leptospiraceae bacterium]
MPALRNYSAGSIIYFAGDLGDEIYVLQKGRIVLLSTSLDQKEDIKEDVRRGEFFGVKSALGHYPREETAQVLTDSQVLVFKLPDFEQFALRNPRVILQMLRVFSSQLRKVHKKVRELLGEQGLRENQVELLNVAETYYRLTKMDYAIYAFEAFLRHYGQHALAPRARKLLQLAKSGAPYPLNLPTIEDELIQAEKTAPSPTSYLESTTSDWASLPGDSLSAPPLDDFSAPPLESTGSIPSGPAQNYYEGLNYFSQGDYAKAIECFERVLQTKTFSGQVEADFLEKAAYEQARSYLKMGQLDVAMQKFSIFLKKYPNSSMQKKAWIHIGEIYEKKNDKARAINCYERAAKIFPEDKDTSMARNRIRELQQA